VRGLEVNDVAGGGQRRHGAHRDVLHVPDDGEAEGAHGDGERSPNGTPAPRGRAALRIRPRMEGGHVSPV
jgi:hypothetical protein